MGEEGGDGGVKSNSSPQRSNKHNQKLEIPSGKKRNKKASRTLKGAPFSRDKRKSVFGTYKISSLEENNKNNSDTSDISLNSDNPKRSSNSILSSSSSDLFNHSNTVQLKVTTKDRRTVALPQIHSPSSPSLPSLPRRSTSNLPSSSSSSSNTQDATNNLSNGTNCGENGTGNNLKATEAAAKENPVEKKLSGEISQSSQVGNGKLAKSRVLRRTLSLKKEQMNSVRKMVEGESKEKKEEGEEEKEREVKKMTKEEFAIKLLNMSCKKGVEFLVKEELVENNADSVAAFLYKHSVEKGEVSRETLGELFGREEEFYHHLFLSFISHLNFDSLDADVALRRMLFTFKLPGEAQKIDRIMRGWAQVYFKSNSSGLFHSSLTLHVLSFALLMLNTDAHTAEVNNKMTCQQFINNLNGSIPSDNPLPQDYLEDMYHRIVNDEIKMKENVNFPFAVKKGYLEVKSKSKIASLSTSRWTKKWCVVEGKHLYMLKTPSDKQAHLKFCLEKVFLIKKPEEDPKRPFIFVLVSQSDFSMENFQEVEPSLTFQLTCSAPSKRSLQDWISLFYSFGYSPKTSNPSLPPPSKQVAAPEYPSDPSKQQILTPNSQERQDLTNTTASIVLILRENTLSPNLADTTKQEENSIREPLHSLPTEATPSLTLSKESQGLDSADSVDQKKTKNETN